MAKDSQLVKLACLDDLTRNGIDDGSKGELAVVLVSSIAAAGAVLAC